MRVQDALSILGLTEAYTKEELKKTYRKLSAKHHPDIAGEGATAKFIEINKAYDLLSSPRKIKAKKVCTHQSIFNVVLHR